MLKEIKKNENVDKMNLIDRYKRKECRTITLMKETWTARLGMFARAPNLSWTLCFLSVGLFRALLTISNLFASAGLEELFILFTWLVVSHWCYVRILQKSSNFPLIFFILIRIQSYLLLIQHLSCNICGSNLRMSQ